MKIKTIYVPIYNIEFYLYDDLTQIGFAPDSHFAAGLEWELANPTSRPKMAFRMDAITMGRIAHECSHLIFRIYARAGIEVDSTNDEHFAYLLEYLVNKVADALLQHKKEIDNQKTRSKKNGK